MEFLFFLSILSRLTMKDSDVLAGVSPVPPPGPFLTPALGEQLRTAQPKFAAFTPAASNSGI